ncbi:MAG: DUF3576 domain-containing protein [Parvibaculaceae bacterium]
MTNNFSMRHNHTALHFDQAGLAAQNTSDKSSQKSRRLPKSAFAAAVLGGVLMLAGCGSDISKEDNYPTQVGSGPNNPNPQGQRDTIFGSDGIVLFGGDDKSAGTSQGIGVNSFLWRASLDTISFMPLASADPFGGVIITDWYQDPKTQGERFKITIYIMDKRLRADGVKVAVSRQYVNPKDPKLGWVDGLNNGETATKIENAILVRARQLRINSVEAGDTK